MTGEQKGLFGTIFILITMIIGGVLIHEKTVQRQRKYDNERTRLAVKKVTGKQDAILESQRAICCKLKLDTTKLEIFDSDFMDSLEKETILPK